MSADVDPMVEAWADKIRQHLEAARHHAQMTIVECVNAGHALIAAKDALRYGLWLPLLGKVGMQPRMAQLFMAVARDPVLSDAKRVSQLPGAIGTLAVLAGLGEDVLCEALDSGEIGPTTTRAKARAFRRKRRALSSRQAAIVVHGVQGRMRDPATDAVVGATSLLARAIYLRELHGIEFPRVELKALDRAEAALAEYRAIVEADS
jgi:hypothetical protein